MSGTRPWRPSATIRLSAALHLATAVAAAAVLVTALIGDGMNRSHWTLLAILAALLIANHLTLTMAGLLPRMALLGPNLTRLPSQARHKQLIAITIDDGPDPDLTPQVLDCLRSAGATASFFVIAERAEQHPELIEQIVRDGHSVENHSNVHSHTFSLKGSKALHAEIATAQQRLLHLSGRTPRFFRAPAGLRNPLLEPVLCQLGLTLASWTRRGYDTVESDPAKVLARLIGRDGALLAAGDVLLLHDGNAARDRDGRAVIVAVLPQLLAACRRRGLRPVSLDQAVPADQPSHQ